MTRRIKYLFFGTVVLAVSAFVWNFFFQAIAPDPLMKVVRASPDNKMETPNTTSNFIEEKDKAMVSYLVGCKIKDWKEIGGYGKADFNYPKTVQPDSAGEGCFLLAQPFVVTNFADKKGMRVVLVNNTRCTLSLPAVDSAVKMVQEALNEKGEWKPIEHLVTSFCGDSYHRVFLKPNQYWEWAAYRYKGEFKTKLRFRLELSNSSYLFSNEFEGRINQSQFVTKSLQD